MRKKGTLSIILGLLLIAAALALCVHNLWTDQEAETASVEVVEEIKTAIPERKPAMAPLDTLDAASLVNIPDMELPDYVRFPEMEMPEKIVNTFPYIGTLEIPALELELPVMSGWTERRFQIAPCRYFGSVYTDNMVLAAHNYPSHFRYIKDLQEGDQVIFTDMDGNVFTYEVALQEILQPTDVEEMQESGYDLTLFTCTLGGKYRVTVRCDRTDNEL